MSMSDMSAVFAAKKALRKATGATLKALDQAHISQECKLGCPGYAPEALG